MLDSPVSLDLLIGAIGRCFSTAGQPGKNMSEHDCRSMRWEHGMLCRFFCSLDALISVNYLADWHVNIFSVMTLEGFALQLLFFDRVAQLHYALEVIGSPPLKGCL